MRKMQTKTSRMNMPPAPSSSGASSSRTALLATDEKAKQNPKQSPVLEQLPAGIHQETEAGDSASVTPAKHKGSNCSSPKKPIFQPSGTQMSVMTVIDAHLGMCYLWYLVKQVNPVSFHHSC